MKTVFELRVFSLALIFLLGLPDAFAFNRYTDQKSLPCMDGKKELPVINEQVLEWKHSTANQFLARARVVGPIVEIYPERNGHDHFAVVIGPGKDDTLELIYNKGFGPLPRLKTGMQVEACGDYITSIAQSGSYPPSPDGAILHWIHKNPRGKGHASGYIIIDGKTFGQGVGMYNIFGLMTDSPVESLAESVF